MVICRAIVRDLFDDRQAAKVFSSLMLVMGLAPILAPLVGGFLAGHFGWRRDLLAPRRGAAWPPLALHRLVLPRVAPARAPHPPVCRGRSFAPTLSLLRHREFMLHAMTVSIGTAGLFAYVGGSPYVFEKIFHISEARFGLYFGPIACGIIGMSQVNGFLAGRFDIRTHPPRRPVRQRRRRRRAARRRPHRLRRLLGNLSPALVLHRLDGLRLPQHHRPGHVPPRPNRRQRLRRPRLPPVRRQRRSAG